MDLDFSEKQKDLVERSRRFAREVILPLGDILEKKSALRHDLYIKMAKEGFLDLSINPMTKTLGYVLAMKEISKIDPGIAVGMSVTNMVAEAIDLYGTQEQKRRILREIGNGMAVPLAFALTEKGAGSDVKALQMKAEPDKQNSQYYTLDGEKQFITNGDIAKWLLVMARTEEGVSAFLFDSNTPGFSVKRIESKLGLHSVNLCDLQFQGCRVPKAALLGQPGKGLHIALASLDSGRIGIAAQAVGIAEAAFESALAYAKERNQFGHPLIEQQAIAFLLADMHMKISAGTQLLYKAAWKKDQGRPFTLEASEAKLFCSEMCNEVASAGLQIHGGYGYVKGYQAEKYFRDARATTLYEGTSEIQRIVIARQFAV